MQRNQGTQTECGGLALSFCLRLPGSSYDIVLRAHRDFPAEKRSETCQGFMRHCWKNGGLLKWHPKPQYFLALYNRTFSRRRRTCKRRSGFFTVWQRSSV